MKSVQLADFLETTEGKNESQREGSNLRPAGYEGTALAFQVTGNKDNYVGRPIDRAQIVLTCGAALNR